MRDGRESKKDDGKFLRSRIGAQIDKTNEKEVLTWGYKHRRSAENTIFNGDKV